MKMDPSTISLSGRADRNLAGGACPKSELKKAKERIAATTPRHVSEALSLLACRFLYPCSRTLSHMFVGVVHRGGNDGRPRGKLARRSRVHLRRRSFSLFALARVSCF